MSSNTTGGIVSEPPFDSKAWSSNQLWVADITYGVVTGGVVYVAIVLDAWSRRVVGYAITRSIDARLTLAARQAAIEGRKTPPGLPAPIDNFSPPMALTVQWDGEETYTTTPRRKAS